MNTCQLLDLLALTPPGVTFHSQPCYKRCILRIAQSSAEETHLLRCIESFQLSALSFGVRPGQFAILGPLHKQ
jgi:hypothetical protein